MEEDYDPMETCPYDPAHRVSRSKMPFHLTRCAKNHTDKKKRLCPYDSRHVLEPRDYDNHLRTCPQRETAVRYKLREPELLPEDDYILPIVAAPLPVAVEEFGAWENEIQEQSYNPLQHIEKKAVVQCLIGASKAKRKKFRMQERRRIAALENASGREGPGAVMNSTEYATFQPVEVESWDTPAPIRVSDSEEEERPLRPPKTIPPNPIPTAFPVDENIDEYQVAEKSLPSSLPKEFVPNSLRKHDEVVYEEYVAAMAKPRHQSLERRRSISISERAPSQPIPAAIDVADKQQIKAKPEVPVWPAVRKTTSNTSIESQPAVDDLRIDKLAISAKEDTWVRSVENLSVTALIESRADVDSTERSTVQDVPEWPRKKTLADTFTEPKYPSHHADLPPPKQDAPAAPAAWSTKRTLASIVSAPTPWKAEIPRQAVSSEDNTPSWRRKDSSSSHESKAAEFRKQPEAAAKQPAPQWHSSSSYEPKAAEFRKQPEAVAKQPAPQWPRQRTISTNSAQSDYESFNGFVKQEPAAKQVHQISKQPAPQWPRERTISTSSAQSDYEICNGFVKQEPAAKQVHQISKQPAPQWPRQRTISTSSAQSDYESSSNGFVKQEPAPKQDVPVWLAKKSLAAIVAEPKPAAPKAEAQKEKSPSEEDVPMWRRKASFTSTANQLTTINYNEIDKRETTTQQDYSMWQRQESSSATSFHTKTDDYYGNARRETAVVKQDVPIWPAKKSTLIASTELKSAANDESFASEKSSKHDSSSPWPRPESSAASSYYSALDDDFSDNTGAETTAAQKDVPIWPARRFTPVEIKASANDESCMPEKLPKHDEPEYTRPLLRRPLSQDYSPWSSKESLSSSSADTKSTFSEKPAKSNYTIPARRVLDSPPVLAEQPAAAAQNAYKPLPRLLTSQQLKNINASVLQSNSAEFSYADAALNKKLASGASTAERVGFRCNTFARLVSIDSEKENSRARVRSSASAAYESRMRSLHQNFKRINAGESRMLSWNY